MVIPDDPFLSSGCVTCVIVKPDGVRRKLVGEIIRRLEQKGLEIRDVVVGEMSREIASKHYAEHAHQPYYSRLIESITTGNCVRICVSGPPNTVELVRTLQGPNAGALPGTIRGDFMTERPDTVTHASDSPESAGREIELHRLNY